VNEINSLYEFVYRGQLAEEALDQAGRLPRSHGTEKIYQTIAVLNFDLLDSDDVDISLRMAGVYAAITSFERSARRFVARVLQSEHGDNWWEECVSERIRKFAESRRDDEDKIKWHGTRGDDPLTYTEMAHLPQIIQQNWTDFEAYIRRIEWASSIFITIERSRNVIMHSGTLDTDDIERVGMNIRDWVKQVGALYCKGACRVWLRPANELSHGRLSVIARVVDASDFYGYAT
jgi:hypothetical protein